MFRKIFLVCLIFASGVALVFCNGSLIETIGDGKINWEAGVVRATGNGVAPTNMSQGQAKAMARRAAIVDCQRNLAEIIYGVRVDSETTVKNFVTESDVIKTQVIGIIKGAQIIAEKSLPDGSYEVTMQIGLYGDKGVSEIVLPTSTDKQKEKMKEEGREIIQLPPPPEEVPSGSYTGLIVDCTGLGVKPCMSPKIISERGDEVYGTMQISEKEAIEKGVIGYANTVDKAKKSWRGGDNPLIVKGKGKSGPLKGDVLISNSDADKIKQANEKAGFLQNLRVSIVI